MTEVSPCMQMADPLPCGCVLSLITQRHPEMLQGRTMHLHLEMCRLHRGAMAIQLALEEIERQLRDREDDDSKRIHEIALNGLEKAR